MTSIGQFTDKIPTAVILYVLIPLLNQQAYLGKPSFQRWYAEKLEYLTRVDICLAISESSRQEAIQHLRIPAATVFNISTAADDKFRKISISSNIRTQIVTQWHINRPFIMYSGAAYPRKNHIRLISAFAKLPLQVRKSHQLVLAGVMPQLQITAFKQHAQSVGLAKDEMVITGQIDDEVMIGLYNLCECFIFPSWHEGFGLPALEAMACGAAVIGSNTSSVPEVIGYPDALFDPYSEPAITAKLNQVLTDAEFRARLIEHGLKQAKTFSWDSTTKRALAALEQLPDIVAHRQRTPHPAEPLRTGDNELIDQLIDSIAGLRSRPRDHNVRERLAASIHTSFPQAGSAADLLLRINRQIRFDVRTRIRYPAEHFIYRLRNLIRK